MAPDVGSEKYFLQDPQVLALELNLGPESKWLGTPVFADEPGFIS